MKEKEVKGLFDTPDAAIDHMYHNKSDRCRIWYGENGVSWNEEYEVTGYVSKSTGREPCYLLVHNRRSIGGMAIYTDSIIRIDRTRDGKILYIHPAFYDKNKYTYHDPVNGKHELYHNGDLIARFDTKEKANRYMYFQLGLRYRT